ncbi:DDE superfamily endonuclease [Ceratobasidium sp. AG-Ba]|nr:DDE superfamily endonuclease [Ceratobasidium sp. AG-Ba]
MACAVRDFVIPASCIVNADQTQVIYSSGDQKTWNASGERQVHVLGADEKRAFTLMVAVSGSGALLPFQAIYAGKSVRSVPDKNTPGYSEAQQLGFLLEYSKTKTYWSTFETMCCWVSDILAPYFRAQVEKNHLSTDQRCLLQLDCWSVHRSARFRTWMRANYPWIIFDYVPGGCTGVFQACDVGIQRVLKLAIRNAAHADVVAETVHALQSGIEPQYLVNDQSLPTLRRRSLNWIIQAYHAVNRPELIKKAFSLCAVPDSTFNLSYESLVSVAARQALMDTYASNPTLYQALTSGAHTFPAIEPGEEYDELPVEDEEGDLDSTVDELCELILDARTVQDTLQTVSGIADSEAESEAGTVVPPTPSVRSTRSGRVPRRPSRYSSTR